MNGKIRKTALWLAVALLMGCLCGCGDDGTDKGFRLPLAGEPAQLDPQVSTDSSGITVLSVLFEGLTRLDADGKAVPAAADWTVSPDGLTYTFDLRLSYWSTLSVRGEETPWDDPVTVVADDFVFGMQRAVSPDTGSALAQQLYSIQNARAIHEGKKSVNTLGVKAVSDTRLTVTLTEPDENFPAKLATTPFMPCNRAFFEYTAGRYGLEKQTVLSNGPFSLTAWNHGQSILLTKNPDYHDASSISPAAVRFVIGATDAAAVTSGTLDVALLPFDQTAAAAKAGVSLVTLQDSIRQVWFNTSAPAFGNADIRRALRDSVEWDTVYGYLEGVGEPAATGYIAPDATVADGEVYRTEANAMRRKTDVGAAQTALARGLAAVQPDKKTPSMPSFTVLAAEDETSANLARYLVQSWQKNLKIYGDLKLVSEAQLLAAVRAGNYQIAICTVTATGLTGAENLRSYTTSGADNYSRYTSAAFDTLAAAALHGGRTALAAAEERLMSDCPTVPLSFPRRYYGIASGVTGLTVRPFNGGTYGSVYEFLQAKKLEK